MVGSQARILYANEEGRIAIALAFNKAVGEGRLKVDRYTCPSNYASYTYVHVAGLCMYNEASV